MENATKALLIAGGILIAILVLSMFVLMFNKMSELQNEQEEQVKVEQLSAFNAEFESYDRKAMYGTDVISLINKVAENNQTYNGNTDYQIIITLNGSIMTSSSSLIGTDNEQSIFKCTKVEYNSLGRVSKIVIESK